MRPLLTKMKTSREVLLDSIDTIRWIWLELLSPSGRSRSVRSVGLLLISTLVMLAGAYATKEAVDALAAGDRIAALWWVLIGVGGLHYVSRFLIAWQAYERELAWNDNHFHVRSRLNRLFFERTTAELNSEDSDIGPEQIEAAQNRIDSLLHLLLFNFAPSVVTIVISIVLMILIDSIAALLMLLLLSFNIVWFLYHNETIDMKMKPVDKGFRQVSNRMAEYWTQFQTTKTAGVEDRVCDHVDTDLRAVLDADRAVWADWFIWLDVRRSLVNITSFVLIFVYGVVIAAWSPGDFAAMGVWTAMVGERFSVIGTIMRHLTEYTTRIKAIRTALTKPPGFDRNKGIIYQPTIGGAHAHEVE
ncbi:MAG: hypothetical protein KC877_01200 [Candidatus Kaiserbacteria bacterium]|nr:hypothetical protein [Candidatus Kaiserbacteria bacterium]MCB9816520.1 hypothetical protein [Candidatus Nomurabacteria bacterium]